MRIIATFLFGIFVGVLSMTGNNTDPDGPLDNTGISSIVVEYENGEWTELRGSGRFTTINEWEGITGYDN